MTMRRWQGLRRGNPNPTRAGLQLLRLRFVALLVVAAVAVAVVVAEQDEQPQPPQDAEALWQCSWSGDDGANPALQEMTYNVGDGDKTVWVYVEPPVHTMYKSDDEKALPSLKTKVVPKFNGLAGKLINMSNKPVTLYWYVPIERVR